MATQYSQVVCLNGHQASATFPMDAKVSGYCEQCGAKLINCCPNCDNPIIGGANLSGDGIVVLAPISAKVPKYCRSCGNPYPWTETAIESAQELIAISDLSSKDIKDFQDTIPDLITDTPRTKTAITKFKLFASKTGSIIANGLRDVLIDVASEATKKALFGA